MCNGHILVLGGARSGKSKFAEDLALNLGKKPALIATGEAYDEEMKNRIALHKERRSEKFTTYEEPVEIVKIISENRKRHDIFLVDCISLWISNLMGMNEISEQENIENYFLELNRTLTQNKKMRIIFVASEVGLGVVPQNKMARNFRDYSGRFHQDLAKICTNVYFIIAGMPVALKGEII